MLSYFKDRLHLLSIFASLTLVLFAGCQAPPEPADLVLKGGRIVTLDEHTPEAEALAVRDGRIAALGTSKEIENHIGDSTKVIDLGGSLAIPGFIESHGHFTGIGNAKMILDLMHVKNWDEVVQMVADAAGEAEPGQWILGRGWHQAKWDKVPEPNVDGLPFHDSLSKASPDNPVLLTHASGHASLANARAMELAGVNRSTKPPDGGEIVKDRRGRPIGVFRETAQGLIRRVVAADRDKRTEEEVKSELKQQIQLAAEECLSNGITSFQDAGSSFATVDMLKSMVDQGELPLRLWVMLRIPNSQLRERIKDYRMINYGDSRLTVRALKRSIDGALGPHGAWLLEPYSDLPSSSGLNTASVESVTETAAIAMENEFQLCVHAIGDRANRETLDIFEKVFAANPDKSGLRWRVEHAQHLHPDDIPRFGQLGVIPAMQGIHCTSDGPYVPIRLGEKRTQEGAYVWQKLMAAGALISNGTDAPVEDVSAIDSFYATVSRKLKDGTVFLPNERMSRMEALRSYTINAAYAAFEEDAKGSLSVGKLADITVLDRDILEVTEDEIPGTQVLYTIVGGNVEFKK